MTLYIGMCCCFNMRGSRGLGRIHYQLDRAEHTAGCKTAKLLQFYYPHVQICPLLNKFKSFCTQVFMCLCVQVSQVCRTSGKECIKCEAEKDKPEGYKNKVPDGPQALTLRLKSSPSVT